MVQPFIGVLFGASPTPKNSPQTAKPQSNTTTNIN